MNAPRHPSAPVASAARCLRRPARALALLSALVATGCATSGPSVRDYPLDAPPTSEEFVKYESLGEGALTSGARALLGTVVTVGPVDAEAVRDTVVLRGQRVGHCYAGALNGQRGLQGDMLLRAEIPEDGVLRHVEAIYDSTGDRSLALCVENGLEGLRFPEGERRPTTEVRLPLRFQAGPVPPPAVQIP